METDIPVCVLTCSGVYCGLHGQKLVKNKPEIADFTPKSYLMSYCADLSPMAIIDNR